MEPADVPGACKDIEHPGDMGKMVGILGGLVELPMGRPCTCRAGSDVRRPALNGVLVTRDAYAYKRLSRSHVGEVLRCWSVGCADKQGARLVPLARRVWSFT